MQHFRRWSEGSASTPFRTLNCSSTSKIAADTHQLDICSAAAWKSCRCTRMMDLRHSKSRAQSVPCAYQTSPVPCFAEPTSQCSHPVLALCLPSFFGCEGQLLRAFESMVQSRINTELCTAVRFHTISSARQRHARSLTEISLTGICGFSCTPYFCKSAAILVHMFLGLLLRLATVQ